MKMMAINPVNYNQQTNNQQKSFNKIPSFGMKVVPDMNKIKTLLITKEPSEKALSISNNITALIEKINPAIDKELFGRAMSELGIPKYFSPQDFIKDYDTKILHVGVEEPSTIIKNETTSPTTSKGLKVIVQDDKITEPTFISSKQLQEMKDNSYLRVICQGLLQFAKKMLKDSPQYQKYIKSYEYLQTPEYMVVKTKSDLRRINEEYQQYSIGVSRKLKRLNAEYQQYRLDADVAKDIGNKDQHLDNFTAAHNAQLTIGRLQYEYHMKAAEYQNQINELQISLQQLTKK